MRAKEFIIENKKPTVKLNEVGIAHAEDLVFFEGSSGALRALNNLKNLPKQKDEVLTIKWDGQVALFAGRDEHGVFIMTDMAGWTAKGYNGLYKSSNEFIKQKQSKGGNPEFLAKIKALWPIMESAFPVGYTGFVKGDVMWMPGNLKESNNKYVFGEGTTTYEVDKNLNLGHRVGQGEAGFAVHGYCASTEDKNPTPLKNTAGLNVNARLCVLGPEIKVEGTIQLDKGKIKEVERFIKQNAKTIDSFLDQNVLQELKMSGLPNTLYTFVNQQTRKRDLTDLASKFPAWVQQNPKISAPMVQKVLDYTKQNIAGLNAIFAVFDAITGVKLDIIHQLDSHTGPVYAHINNIRGGEGYVASDPTGYLKLVDRSHFSAANLNDY